LFTPQKTFTIAVTGGAADKPAATPAQIVTITAAVPTGKTFVRWEISPAVTFAEGTSATDAIAKFVMPFEAVTATAVFADIPTTTHVVTFSVVGGTGGTLTATNLSTGENVVSGSEVLEGTLLSFAAVPAPGYRVKAWTLNGAAMPGWGVNPTINHPITEAANITVEFEPIPAGPDITRITIDSAALTSMARGASKEINCIITPGDAVAASIVWTSSNESIAYVKDGRLVAAAIGNAVITCVVTSIYGTTFEVVIMVRVF